MMEIQRIGIKICDYFLMAWILLLFCNCTIKSDNCLFDEMSGYWWKFGKCSKVFGVTIKHFL